MSGELLKQFVDAFLAGDMEQAREAYERAQAAEPSSTAEPDEQATAFWQFFGAVLVAVRHEELGDVSAAAASAARAVELRARAMEEFGEGWLARFDNELNDPKLLFAFRRGCLGRFFSSRRAEEAEALYLELYPDGPTDMDAQWDAVLVGTLLADFGEPRRAEAILREIPIWPAEETSAFVLHEHEFPDGSTRLLPTPLPRLLVEKFGNVPLAAQVLVIRTAVAGKMRFSDPESALKILRAVESHLDELPEWDVERVAMKHPDDPSPGPTDEIRQLLDRELLRARVKATQGSIAVELKHYPEARECLSEALTEESWDMDFGSRAQLEMLCAIAGDHELRPQEGLAIILADLRSFLIAEPERYPWPLATLVSSLTALDPHVALRVVESAMALAKLPEEEIQAARKELAEETTWIAPPSSLKLRPYLDKSSFVYRAGLIRADLLRRIGDTEAALAAAEEARASLGIEAPFEVRCALMRASILLDAGCPESVSTEALADGEIQVVLERVVELPAENEEASPVRMVAAALLARMALRNSDLATARCHVRAALRQVQAMRTSTHAAFLPAAWPWPPLPLVVFSEVLLKEAAQASNEGEPQVAERLKRRARRVQRAVAKRCGGFQRMDGLMASVLASLPATDGDVDGLDQLPLLLTRLSLKADRIEDAERAARQIVPLREHQADVVTAQGQPRKSAAIRSSLPQPRHERLREIRRDLEEVAAMRSQLHQSPDRAPLAHLVSTEGCAAAVVFEEDDGRVGVELWLPGDEALATTLLLRCRVEELSTIVDRLDGLVQHDQTPPPTLWKALFRSFWGSAVADTRAVRGYGGFDASDTLFSSLDQRSIEHLVVVPGGSLARVPFHAAWDHQDVPILESFGLSYLPSTQHAEQWQEELGQPLRALLLADPGGHHRTHLRHARQEVAEIARHFEAPMVMGAHGRPVTPDQFLEEARDLDWLHVACHGKAAPSADEFLKAAFLVSSVDTAAGWVSLGRLAEHGVLRPGATAVLACCCASDAVSSALLSEPASLAHGLLSLGCRTVIAPAWSIGDAETSVFVQHLYRRRFKGGHEIRDALRLTQLSAIRGELDAEIAELQSARADEARFGGALRWVSVSSHVSWAAWSMLGV